jgi:hypothetical protein
MSDGAKLDPALVEYVAKAMVNADLPQFGTTWPWPEDDVSWAEHAREEARELATVAIRAVLGWKPEAAAPVQGPPEKPSCTNCENNSGYYRVLGRDNNEIVLDCEVCNPPPVVDDVCRSPNGRTDGHMSFVKSTGEKGPDGLFVFVCAFCGKRE